MTVLHPRTSATLADLRKARWFSFVGVPDAESAIVLESWEEAIGFCSMDDWQDLLLEAANQYCERLVERDEERFQKWNDLVAEIKSITIPLVKEKTVEVAAANELPQIFIDTVQWDILHVCMEAEFADIFPPGFYASQAYWYVKGHFPCGWAGDFPEGTLIIY